MTRLAFFVLVSVLLFSTFSAVSGEPVCRLTVYSRDQVLALSSTVVQPHERPDVPHELRRRRRCGCHSGAVRHSRGTCYRPVLPAVIMGNVSKMDELTELTQHQRDYHECSIMVLTETWPTELTLDTGRKSGRVSTTAGRQDSRER